MVHVEVLVEVLVVVLEGGLEEGLVDAVDSEAEKDQFSTAQDLLSKKNSMGTSE